MAEIILPPDTSSTEGPSTEGTSSLGNKYTYGSSEPDQSTEPDAKPEGFEEKKSYTRQCNWPPSDEWKEVPEPDRSIMGITRYKLFQAKAGNWVFWFTNTEHYYFQFTNTGGETYSNNTFVNSDHWILMDPDKKPPCIIQVKGD